LSKILYTAGVNARDYQLIKLAGCGSFSCLKWTNGCELVERMILLREVVQNDLQP
jgi:hypothetical protein